MILETPNKFDSLTGAIGLVFLMFLGRETIANHIAINLLGAGILENNDVIYQYTKRLEKMFLLKVVSMKKHGKGQPRILTANIEQLINYIVPHSLGEFSTRDRKRIMSTIILPSDVVDYYPEYLLASLNKQKISTLKWSKLLSNYLFFCLEFINTCHLSTQIPKVIEPTVDQAVKKWKNLLDKGKISKETFKVKKNFVELSFDLSSLVQNLPKDQITEISSKIETSDNIYKDKFMEKMLFTSIAINDPHLAGWLDFYRKNIIHPLTVNKN
jgi:hypothetical protein